MIASMVFSLPCSNSLYFTRASSVRTFSYAARTAANFSGCCSGGYLSVSSRYRLRTAASSASGGSSSTVYGSGMAVSED